MNNKNTLHYKDPARWLDEHGDYLFRFAVKQLRDSSLAEDAVQETLLAALQAIDNYAGESSLRTWLTGILKHKIIDILRKQARENTFYDHDSHHDTNTALENALFDRRGEWNVPQNNWGDPETALDQARFWDAFSGCYDRLSPKLARIFSLREISGLPTEEICTILNITASNCWVLLYRARLALKECLERAWLDDNDRRQP
ncbi:MAG: sigma-70 family RNA polymerase sigma factor [Gammaproteobacteria bacterium]|nr:sigma-70 family RNA polymerase sigma factor [Gammaproteobacteria bacterium]